MKLDTLLWLVAERLSFGFFTILLSSCALSDEGAIDYRKSESSSVECRQKSVDNVLAGLTSQAVTGCTAKPPQPVKNNTVTPVRLVRKDIQNTKAIIEKNSKITIRLREGFLGHCTELLRNPLRSFNKNCEIAIIFKAFELGDGDFNFSPNAIRDGRVVYFSHDVTPGQFLNLHNMPVYGPLDFNGKPIGIDIYVVEVDAEDNQAQSLMKTLAKVGASFYPPSQVALGVLDKLGGALLQGNTDDINFRYSMVLDPLGGYHGMAYATTEAGNYAFIREDERDKSTPWDDLWLDENNGRIYNKDGSLYRDNTYLVMQINRNAGTDAVQLAQNTYGPFRDALEKDQTERAQAIETALMPTLKTLAIQRVHIRNFAKAQKLLEVVRGMDFSPETPDTTAQRSAFDLFHLIMRSTEKLTANSKNEDGISCVSAFAEAPKKDETAESDLSGEQVDYLLNSLSIHVGAASDQEQKKFSCAKTVGFASFTYDDFLTLLKKNKP